MTCRQRTYASAQHLSGRDGRTRTAPGSSAITIEPVPTGFAWTCSRTSQEQAEKLLIDVCHSTVSTAVSPTGAAQACRSRLGPTSYACLPGRTLAAAPAGQPRAACTRSIDLIQQQVIAPRPSRPGAPGSRTHVARSPGHPTVMA